MKVYILIRNPFPNGFAATNRIRCYAEGLIKSGIQTEVLVVCRTERSGVPVVNQHHMGEDLGIPFRYIDNNTQRASSFIKRRFQDIISLIRICLFIIFHVSSKDIVLLFGHKNELFFLPLCKMKGINVYRELCEYPYATINDSLYNKIRRKVNLNFVFPMYSGFIAISEELVKLAETYKSANARVIKIPILVSCDMALTKSYIHKRPYIFHSGTMYERKDAIVSTFRAYAIAMRQLNFKIDFILAGPPSPHMDEIQSIIDSNNLQSNVIFLGKLSKDEVQFYQNGAFLAILNKNDNLQNRHGFSTKLGELLLSETPVITTTVGEAKLWLKDGISAYITEPHCPKLIAEQIVRAYFNEDERKSIAKEGKKIAVESFDCIKNGRRLALFFYEGC